MKIRIATRKSKLALFQAEYVANKIKQQNQEIEGSLYILIQKFMITLKKQNTVN